MELRHYMNLLRRWWWLVVLGAVVSGAAAFIFSFRQMPIYQATSTILINQARSATQSSDYTDLLTSQSMARTYAQMLQDWPVLEQVVNELGLQGDLEDIQRAYGIDVSVTPVRDTQLVNLQVEANGPQLAVNIANSLPAIFAKINQARQQDRFTNTRQDLQKDLAAVQADIASTQQALGQVVDPKTPAELAEQSRLQNTLSQYGTSYSALLNSLEQLRMTEAQSVDNIVITTPAKLPGAPVRPRILLNTLLGAIIGAMLGLGAAFLIDYLDDTVKTPDDVQKMTGLSTLAGVVKLEGATPDERLVARSAPKSPGAEAYRVLRTNLQFSSVDKALSTLVFTSAGAGEGKSTTITNLAIAIAQGDKRVILVDADLRRPSLHRMLKLTNNVGLSTALLDKGHDPGIYLRDSDVPNLRVMTTGPIPPNPAELLNSERMREMIEILKGEADVVLFDTPPVLAVADASILASLMDGTLLVVGVGETRGEMLKQAMQRLKNVGVQPLGVVLNKLTERNSGYYYYYYAHYGSRYADAEANDNGRKPGNSRLRRSSKRPKAEQTS